jgi:predicted anti-sigma-YlaC factor YlaD
MATKAVANALTGEGSSTVFTGDEDPELVGAALPFAIKLYEALLSMQPDHQGLILTTGSLFVMYANAFVQGPAELLPPERFDEKQGELERAKKFYLRGVEILNRGLEKKYPGWGKAAESGNLEPYLKKTKKEDVPLLYWSTAGTLSAFSLNPFDLELGMKLPVVTAMINRAYELDPDFNDGALDDFFVLFYASLPETMGGDKSKVDTYFNRAIEKSKGQSAGPYVSYAQVVSIPAQDYEGFKQYLETALEVDVNVNPANRLVNIISQRKARHLLDSAQNYFWELEDPDQNPWDTEAWPEDEDSSY